MLRFVPPAGSPLTIREIVRAARAAASFHGGADEVVTSFARSIHMRHVFGAVSGRAALWLILRSLRSLRPGRCVVAVPAYTCYSVAAAIVRAGLKLYPVDVDPATLDFDFSQLESLPGENLLCIVTSNLFGLVNDVPRIGEIAGAKGAFVVDDAAQSVGASRNGRPSGTFGDVGFYSLGRGKALAAVAGGLIVTNSDEIASALRDEAERLPKSSFVDATRLLFQLLAYSIFLRPRLYWIPNSLSFLKLGITEFAPDFQVGGLPLLSCALLPQLLNKLPRMNHMRRDNAAAITASLEGNPRFFTPRPPPDCEPTYVRLPIVARDVETRDRAVFSLCAVGIGATRFYPSAICDIPGTESHMAVRNHHCPQAESLARRLLTVPTHPLVTERDLSQMAKVLGEI